MRIFSNERGKLRFMAIEFLTQKEAISIFLEMKAARE